MTKVNINTRPRKLTDLQYFLLKRMIAQGYKLFTSSYITLFVAKKVHKESHRIDSYRPSARVVRQLITKGAIQEVKQQLVYTNMGIVLFNEYEQLRATKAANNG